MRAASLFATSLLERVEPAEVQKVTIELYGSLAMTGIGHGTDRAVLLGLEGESPESVDPDLVDHRMARIENEGNIYLLGSSPVDFSMAADLIFHKGKRLPFHSNAMRFKAVDKAGNVVANQIYYSVGGGFVVAHEEALHAEEKVAAAVVPYPFTTAAELLSHCKNTGMMIYEIVMENEKALRSEKQIRKGILHIWDVMNNCMERGFVQEGILPGGLGVKRRASDLYRQLSNNGNVNDPTEFMEWVSLYAMAVNEENAAGGRVVTAPTNGAAGIIPAVLRYYLDFTQSPTQEGIIQFMLTATAMGILYKLGASISGAEMGCQGEVGVACSMAAAGLTAALGGTNEQIEDAAEIGMEHNLGLTCDPVGGLVQIPCIERNAMGTVKAINASKLALRGNGESVVSLDQVIAAMKQTGDEMKSTYKETSEAGLAVHVSVRVPEC
jgi:L-serine dehydratase